MAYRSRKFVKNTRKISIASISLILSLIILLSILAYYHLSKDNELNTFDRKDEELSNDNDEFVANVTEIESGDDKVLSFGSDNNGGDHGGDSRYWEKDDRRRDMEEVNVSEDGKRGDALKNYVKEFEASLKNVGQLITQHVEGFDNDEYDDAIDLQDAGREDHEDVRRVEVENRNGSNIVSKDGGLESGDKVKTELENGDRGKGKADNRSVSGSGFDRPPKQHTGCEIKFLNSTAQLVEPPESEKFSNFLLQYTDSEEIPSGQEQWIPRFSGHQSLKEREESFYARDQRINCGFVKGPIGSLSTGFDLGEEDMRYMSSCHIAVSSCIFGSSDNVRSPFGKTVTRLSRKSVCFAMFMDENTLQTLSSEGQKPDNNGFIGLWKIVLVKDLPFDDMRRVGKIPKFLAHRLFPSARYSIWLDSKLRLQTDPLLILEYFLWRKGYEYAISKHYRRHCVWEEVEQNKKLNKFNHTIIDQQFLFYQADGLKRFNSSDPNKPLPSNVPEGSFIVRAHTPMSNLFSCLWYNEVDRFTPRDQLSFAYVYNKLRRMNPEKPFYFNMFKDCERRSIAKLFRHRSEEKRNITSHAVQ
ncbi:hypothetical protein ACHQM5_022660 [Ranunculus cassubicifolius]